MPSPMVLRSLLLSTLAVHSHAAYAEPKSPPSAAQPAPLEAYWAPLVLPASLVVPGVGHWFRGDEAASEPLFTGAKASWGGLLLAALPLTLSGAADLVSYACIPLALVSGTTLMALGVADAIGTFTTTPLPDLPSKGTHRVELTQRLAFDPLLEESRYFALEAEIRRSQYEVRATLIRGTLGDFSHGGVAAGWRILAGRADEGVLGELGLEQDRSSVDRYTVSRILPRVRVRYDMRRIAPTLAHLEHEAWLGYFQEETRYTWSTGSDRDTSNGVSGGAKVSWSLPPRVLLAGSYEHARTGLDSGIAQGFIGTFTAAVHGRVVDDLWLVARAATGNPAVYTFGTAYQW